MAVTLQTMHSGLLRRTLQVQQKQPQLNANGYGEPTSEWVTVATVRAFVEPLAGRELWMAQQVRPDISHRVTIRYFSPGLAPAMRFLEGSRVLNIESVADLEERHRWHQCLCREEV